MVFINIGFGQLNKKGEEKYRRTPLPPQLLRQSLAISQNCQALSQPYSKTITV